MENTARNYESYLPKRTPAQENDGLGHKSVAVSSKKVAISKQEARLLAALGAIMMVLMISLVSIKVSITISQQQLQKVNNSIDNVTSKNVDLRQEIGELTSAQRLAKYAKKHDMTLSDKNVRNVSK